MSGLITWSPGMTLESIEKQVVLKAFNHYRGNKTATANALGIAIRTLDTKLEKYEVDVTAERERQAEDGRKRESLLARSRGVVPNNVGTQLDPPAHIAKHVTAPSPSAARNVPGPNAGVHVESVANSPAQPAVSVPERKEVQEVLPRPATPGGSPRKR